VIQALGLFTTEQVTLPDGVATLNQVAGTLPRAGSTVYRGDTVVLLVS